MKYYKDNDDKIHCLEDEKYNYLLPAGCVEITAEAAELIRNPPLTLNQSKARKYAELAAYRYGKESAGIAVGGSIIKTDEISQAKLTGTWATAQMNPSVSINWKGENGWVQITKMEIDAIATAVSAHVEACYSREMEHYMAIESLTTPDEVEAYDFSTGWPT